MMVTTSFCGLQLSRLALGDNPFNGHSYIPDVHSGSEMMDYYSEANCVRTLFEAQEQGVNTYIGLGDPHVLRMLRQFKLQGGSMNIMFQNYPPIDLEVNLPMMLGVNPAGIYHQGTTTDYMMECGESGKLRDRIRMIKDAGVLAGLGTHVPETVLRAEDEDWGVDFYMTCLYNARKTQRGEQSGFITGKSKQLVFYPDDRFLMFNAIRQATKPCIAFKLFAGGQVFHGKSPDEIPSVVETVFRETYSNIKPTDIACIGVFQKYKDQLKENISIANRVLSNGGDQ